MVDEREKWQSLLPLLEDARRLVYFEHSAVAQSVDYHLEEAEKICWKKLNAIERALSNPPPE